MLIHHLTVTQNKHFYVSHDPKCYFTHDGLNPQDAEEHGLKPVIALTLSVEGAGVYHQKLFFRDDLISMSEFLYDAWTNNKMLGGIPDALHVDQNLVKKFPLYNVIHNLDPDNHLKTIITKHSAKFGASKAQAQNQVSNVLISTKRIKESNVASIKEMLSVINDLLLEYSQDPLNIKLCENKIKKQIMQETFARKRNLPRYVTPLDHQVFHETWVSQAAYSVPDLSDNQSLVVSSSENWLDFLKIYNEGEEILPSPGTGYYRSELYRWANELDGAEDAMKSLPFGYDDILPQGLSYEAFNTFLTGRSPLETHVVSQLEENLSKLPMVLFPKNIKMMKGAYEHISHGGDVNRSFEIYSHDMPNADYRIVFGEACYDEYFAIVIKNDTNAYKQDLKKVLINLHGKIDIGSAGMTSLIYWIDKFTMQKNHEAFRLFIDMTKEMLDSIEGWASHA